MPSYFFIYLSNTTRFWFWDRIHCKQANSENCGPPLGNKFDLEVGQRSRSRHGTIG